MKKTFIAFLLSLVLMLFSVNGTLADDLIFADSLESYNPGDLNGQGDWEVTNYYGNPHNKVKVSEVNFGTSTKYVEITNNDSLIATRTITPVNSGIFQFRMKHNKSGLFYFYALTSDQGKAGQLLLSIQFTESKGILLEESNKQTTLLSDYNADQWYLFTIDFDNSRGERGTFKVKIDDGSYREYEYIHSQSTLFDFAKIVFGSESDSTAVSAFNISAIAPNATTTTIAATTTVSTSLRQLSIALATSSITANLDDGYIVTATYDIAPSLATTTPETGTSTETSLGGFFTDIIETVIDIFTEEEVVEPVVIPVEEMQETPTIIPEETIDASPTQSAPIDNIETENTIQSSVSSDETNNAVTTSTF